MQFWLNGPFQNLLLSISIADQYSNRLIRLESRVYNKGLIEIRMGNFCETSPTQLQFDRSKYKPSPFAKSQLKRMPSIEHLIEEDKKGLPNSSFARPIKSIQLPQLTLPVKLRLQELGPYKYEQSQNNAQSRGQILPTPYQLNNSIYKELCLPWAQQNSKIYYDGQWKNGKMHGRGKYYLPGRSLLQTVSKNGHIQGAGRIIVFDGSYFEGDLKGASANGKGKYVSENSEYIGNFKNNLHHGQGQQIGPGYMFKGYFQNGKRKYGTMIYGQQEKYSYQGQMQDDLPHGKGTLSNDIGVYQGQFEYGKKSGKGQFRWKDAHLFKGRYANDLKNGQGALYNPVGKKVVEGVWKDDNFIH